MAQNLPSGISKEHILAAIENLKAGMSHAFSESTKYDLVHDGERFPPKAVIGLAAQRITGTPFLPEDFTGGLESKCFRILEDNGFTIELKNGDRASIPLTDHPESNSNERAGNPNWMRDEHILALDLYLATRTSPPAKDGPEVIDLSRSLNRLGERLFPSNSRLNTFRNPAGVYMKLMNFRRLDPIYTETGRVGLQRGAFGEKEVWEEFAGDPLHCKLVASAILASLDASEDSFILFDTDEDIGVEEAPEGRLLTRRHLARERNRKLVASKIKNTLKAKSRLECEVCQFNFALFYGMRGEGFIECHHTKPVCSLAEEGKTHIKDLALLCSNCHRIIHRRRPWLTIEELRALITRT